MTLTLILLLFFGGSMTANRLHYGDKTVCRHKAWYQEKFPGASMPLCKPEQEKSLDYPLYVK